MEELLPAYLGLVSPELFEDRSASDHTRALASHCDLAAVRPDGTARIRVLTPTATETGWSAGGRSVIEVVVDDMPHLVDSVSVELARRHHQIHVVVHPVFDVARDTDGALNAVVPVADARLAPEPGLQRESWLHVEVDRIHDDLVAETEAALERVLGQVRLAVEDEPSMAAAVVRSMDRLRAAPPSSVAPEAASEAVALLQWLTADHFVCWGRRDYRIGATADGGEVDGVLEAVPDTGLGVLRGISDSADPDGAPERRLSGQPVTLRKSGARAIVSPGTRLDELCVTSYDEAGRAVGVTRFLGLLTRRAARASVSTIPVVRRLAAEVMRRSGFDPTSHAGTTLAEIIETLPREELFHARVDEITATATVAMDARERRATRVALRRDGSGRYVSVLVMLPRDRFDAGVRRQLARVVSQEFRAADVEFDVRMEASIAHLYFVAWMSSDHQESRVDESALVGRLVDAARDWRDELVAAVIRRHGEDGPARFGVLLDGLPRAYQESFPAEAAADDVGRLAALAPGDVDFALYLPPGSGRARSRLKVYRVGHPDSLSRVLPILTSLGVEVTDQRPYDLRGDAVERDTTIDDFGLRWPDGALAGPDHDADEERLRDALRSLWTGRSEVDDLNVLVLAAGLTNRQVTVIRAYAKYLRQIGSPFTLPTVAAALRRHVRLTRLLVDLFEARFTPGSDSGRSERQEEVVGRIVDGLDEVDSIDDDRVLRSFVGLIRATVRTNVWQRVGGEPKEYVALKLDPSGVADLPLPRPAHEIFVDSPIVEGVHLRFGAIARGGLRWSDRRDDFRTEILGLVKAQMVKNAIITPLGAKGGFVAKRMPSRGSSRDAWLAEGRRAYTTFLRGLLDVTDNVVGGRTVPPPDVVRHDPDDSYLVVAADKGTATFSDLANEVGAEYAFWLGDAFASGGSVGYDHKAMGITARGAWVSVQRHFRESGGDCQQEDFTCVGIGDMSGDVFGNGMLCSEHTRLVAAFDHRDIFIDPDPVAAVSYAERRRLFGLPRSSWQDYDRSAISAGGGVWSRRSKSVPLDPRARAALGLDPDVAALSPNDLIRAILRAPVDLLWNGGVGTYVKASTESHADAGDKGNDPVRVDARDLRASIVGEGGNLGLTQAARVEYAAAGGRINTDAIDNSAGVDCSDREVNIKILLDGQVATGALSAEDRDELLRAMSDEVAELVLQDNDDQNRALGDAEAHPVSPSEQERWMAQLERSGVLSREVEGLPSPDEMRGRTARDEVLTAPEHAVLLSWTKIELGRALLASDLVEDPSVVRRLPAYFPSAVRDRFGDAIAGHPLRREILATQVANEVVNRAGATYWPRLAAETGASAAAVVRAFLASQTLLDGEPLLTEVCSLDFRLDPATQARLRSDIRTGVERGSRWLLQRGPDGRGDEAVGDLQAETRALVALAPELLTRAEAEWYVARRHHWLEHGVPDGLADRAALMPSAASLLGVAALARGMGRDVDDALITHVAVGDRLGLPALVRGINALPRTDRWSATARSALRDDLLLAHERLTSRALSDATWARSKAVENAVAAIGRVGAEAGADLARLSVALRIVRDLVPG